MTPNQVKDLANGLGVIALLLLMALAFYREMIVLGSYYRQLDKLWRERFDGMRDELTKQVSFWQNETIAAKQAELTTKTENSVLLREMATTLKELAGRLTSLRQERYPGEDVYGHMADLNRGDSDRQPHAQERRRQGFSGAPEQKDRE